MPSDLARELAAHPRFRWAPGMLARGMGYQGWGPRRWVETTVRLLAPVTPHLDHARPDLADAATAGILHDMLPDGWSLSRWSGSAGCTDGITTYTGRTLGEAAARALLALWGPA